ncbi:immunity 49 family protein [Inquilinus sp. CA228]|uniref:immunity 49 family protein n=1 Tax=Inquilinus sp. CA228 TaxID=3455609 RepID=UPI003F8D422D
MTGGRAMDGDSAGFVARHRPGRDREALAARAERRAREIPRLRDSLAERPGNLVPLTEEALALAGLRQLLGPEDEVPSRLRLSARAAMAAGVMVTPAGPPLRVDLGPPGPPDPRGPVELPRGREPPVGLTPRRLVQACHAALATRDRIALDLFAQVPVDRVARQPPAAEDRIYGLAHAQGLQALLRGDAAGNQLLLQAIQGCNDTALAPASRDYAQFIVSPEIELTLLHRDSEAAKFDQALRNALVLHRRYWADIQANPGESQDSDPAGFIALGPLAWAAMRHDQGLPVGIRSDYLPRGVVEGAV